MPSKKCRIPKCTNPSRSLGYCVKHYTRFRRYKDPLGCSPNKGHILHWLKGISLLEVDFCIPWAFSKYPTGYGQFKYKNIRGAHRVMCVVAHGKPPTLKHEAAHACGRRDCVNPRHISWKTPSDNRKDKLLHNTHVRGERNHKAKLTEADVRYIKRMRGIITGRALAERYGVTPALISRIYNKQCWAWLPD